MTLAFKSATLFDSVGVEVFCDLSDADGGAAAVLDEAGSTLGAVGFNVGFRIWREPKRSF
jgi:hypothetical protein